MCSRFKSYSIQLHLLLRDGHEDLGTFLLVVDSPAEVLHTASADQAGTADMLVVGIEVVERIGRTAAVLDHTAAVLGRSLSSRLFGLLGQHRSGHLVGSSVGDRWAHPERLVSDLGDALLRGVHVHISTLCKSSVGYW